MEEVDEGFCRTNVCVGCPTCCQWCTDEGRKDKKVVLPFLTSHIKSLPPGIKIHGKFEALSQRIEHYVSEMAQLCTPDEIFICDGSEQENKALIDMMVEKGVLVRLTKYDNCYLARSDPQDVARVESKTFICTEDKRESVPLIKEGVVGRLGNWMHPHDMEVRLKKLFSGCMKGRTMYVIPYSMGPVGSPLAEIGIQLTDSAYVAVCMRVMTRMGSHVLEALGDKDFVRSLHSVGRPLPVKPGPYSETWPCNPEDTVISHFPHHREIISYGSGYGGNALLGKKCFALRIASSIGLVEGWLAEHMLIMGLTSPEGKKKYVAAAFPSQCGKTNLAMMMPSVPGWKVECVGDDIAWMRFDEEGNLRAINPEAGFFGVAPGTSSKTNPNALVACMKDTIFTNVAETSDGGFYWEGLDEDVDISNVDVTTWKGEKNWKKDSGTNAAHPNSRFCAPSRNCPIMDPHWEDPKGVPIEAIIFGGRRPRGVPLVYESFSWQHGVFVASSMCSEATAAAEHKGRQIMRDPFAMRPFFGYNAGHYIQHWLALGKKPGAKMPKIFHVNWFRRDENNKFLWPGFGENIRVLEWIFRRADNEDIAVKSPVGYVPKEGTLNTKGLAHVDFEKLMSVPKDYWLEECQSIRSYFDEQFGEDMPEQIRGELSELEKRIKSS